MASDAAYLLPCRHGGGGKIYPNRPSLSCGEGTEASLTAWVPSRTPGPLLEASGGVAERSKAADCKSADFGLRRFESFPLHQLRLHVWGNRRGSGRRNPERVPARGNRRV